MIQNEPTAEGQQDNNPTQDQNQGNHAPDQNPEPNWKDEAAKWRRLYEKDRKDGDQPPAPLPEEKPKSDLGVDTVVDLVRATRGLQDNELNELTAESKSLGIPLMKFISSKAGQSHLAEIRRTSKSTDATPGPSNNIPLYGGKPADDTLKDAAAAPADKQKAFESKVGKVLRKGSPNQSV